MIPQLRDWHARYEPRGLTVVGVHSPEFFWEKPVENVAAAVKELGVTYPVVQDNDLRRTSAWANTFLGRDHYGRAAAAAAKLEAGGDAPEPEKKGIHS